MVITEWPTIQQSKHSENIQAETISALDKSYASKPVQQKSANDTLPTRIPPTTDNILKSFTKPDLYSSSLEANITGISSTLNSQMNIQNRASPTSVHEARIVHNKTPKSSPADKSFTSKISESASKTKKDDYDESKNPFADDLDDDDYDATNPFKDDYENDDYNKNMF